MLPDIRVRQRDYLLEISRALTEELDLDKLLSRILKYAIEMLAGHAGFIALSSQQGNWSWRLLMVCQTPSNAFWMPGWKNPAGSGPHKPADP
jgi:hypothetical protein